MITRAAPLVVSLVILVACNAGPRAGTSSSVQFPVGDSVHVWREFVDLLRTGPFPPGKVAPYREELRAPMLSFLRTMSGKADWSEWQRGPEVFRVGDQVHFLEPLTFDGHRQTYCFSFVMKHGAWFFQHLEAISIRLDHVGPLPATRFPDLDAAEKAWIREEVEVSRDVWMFNTLRAEKGRDAALAWFKDGAGYSLAARAWVPFVRPSKAFILYLCWEQANLRGNDVVLERLDEEEGIVRMRPLYFALYNRAAHLKQQIGLDDYRSLFEFRWQDRAASVGWSLAISYAEDECIFQFNRARE